MVKWWVKDEIWRVDNKWNFNEGIHNKTRVYESRTNERKLEK